MSEAEIVERPHLSFFFRLPSLARLAFAACVGVVVALGLEPWVTEAHMRVLAAWDAGVATYLALAWTVIRALDARETRARVERHDQSGRLVLLLVLAAACASLVAIIWGLRAVGKVHGGALDSRVALTVLALAGSWLMIHTVFAFHYAKAYYRPLPAGSARYGGLRFPGGAEPDYEDFFYYACVIGMTSQVGDVAVTSRPMRQLTLMHSIASFAFNLVFLALGVNLVAAAIQ